MAGSRGRSSPFSWACALAVLAAAACVTVLAMHGRRNARITLAMGLVVIAVDEAFGLHERLAADLDLRALETLTWRTCALVGYTILLGVVAILLVIEIRSSRRPTLLIAGLRAGWSRSERALEALRWLRSTSCRSGTHATRAKRRCMPLT